MKYIHFFSTVFIMLFRSLSSAGRFQKHPGILAPVEKAQLENAPPIEAPAAMAPQARQPVKCWGTLFAQLYPNSWMVRKAKSQSMDDDWGIPIAGNLHT